MTEDMHMSSDEVRAVRWVEWILAPVLVVSVIALGKCTASAQDELIVLQRDVAQINEVNGETKEAIKDINNKQTTIVQSQHEIEIQVERIETHQEHFKQEIKQLRTTSEEILTILRKDHN